MVVISDRLAAEYPESRGSVGAAVRSYNDAFLPAEIITRRHGGFGVAGDTTLMIGRVGANRGSPIGLSAPRQTEAYSSATRRRHAGDATCMAFRRQPKPGKPAVNIWMFLLQGAPNAWAFACPNWNRDEYSA